MLWDVLRRDKLQPPYIGPYTIDGIQSNGTYVISDVTGDIYHREVTIDQLKAIPDNLLSKDNFHRVDHLVSKEKNREGEWVYRIRYSGLPESENEFFTANHIESDFVTRFDYEWDKAELAASREPKSRRRKKSKKNRNDHQNLSPPKEKAPEEIPQSLVVLPDILGKPGKRVPKFVNLAKRNLDKEVKAITRDLSLYSLSNL